MSGAVEGGRGATKCQASLWLQYRMELREGVLGALTYAPSRAVPNTVRQATARTWQNTHSRASKPMIPAETI